MNHETSSDIVRLKDILTAINTIENYSDRVPRWDDKMALQAIAYNIAIIGEASGKLSPELRKANSAIPWDNIIGMRHRIIHDYGGISTDRLQEVVRHHLPELKERIERIAGKHRDIDSGK